MAPRPNPTARGRRVGLARAGSLAVILAGVMILSRSDAQSPGPDVPVSCTRLPQITIPFSLQPGARIKHAELYYSADRGRAWQFHAHAQPTDTRFREFIAPADGEYWFAVRSIDVFDKAIPQTLQQLDPKLRVIVDRRPPQILLRPLTGARPNLVGVEWDVRDDSLDLNRFQLDYRVPGLMDWTSTRVVEAKAAGAQYWSDVGPGTRMEVRLRVGDRAGNEAEQTLVLAQGADARTGDAPQPAPGNFGNPPAASPRVFHVNSRRFGLPFTLSNVGVSGISVRELWYTRDNGRSWQKAPKGPDDSILPTNPGENTPNDKFAFTADADGQFGFSVVVRSGVGLGDHDPRPGDAPRMTVEVDTLAPQVQVLVRRGQGADIRNVTIEWSAADKNLADRPVTLLYAEKKEGEWKPIIAEQDARGTYTWVVPESGPFQFHVQARAADKAGNFGTDTTKDQIIVDASTPKADIQPPVALPGGGR